MLLFRAIDAVSYSALAIRLAAVLVAVVLASPSVRSPGRWSAAAAARGTSAAARPARRRWYGSGARRRLAGRGLPAQRRARRRRRWAARVWPLALAGGGPAGCAPGGCCWPASLCGGALLVKQSAIDAPVVLARAGRDGAALASGAARRRRDGRGARRCRAARRGHRVVGLVVRRGRLPAHGRRQPAGGRGGGTACDTSPGTSRPSWPGAAVVAVVALVVLRRRGSAERTVVGPAAVAAGGAGRDRERAVRAPALLGAGRRPARRARSASRSPCVPRRAGLALAPWRSSSRWGSRSCSPRARRSERTTTVVTDHRLLVNDQVSAWLRAHSAPHRPGVRLRRVGRRLPAGRPADRLPYLWQANVEHIPGARDELAQYLSGAQAPRFVVVYQKPTDPGIDPDAQLAPILTWQYAPVAKVGGYEILEHQ